MLIWGVAYFFWLRHFSKWAAIGSFFFLLIFATLVGLGKTGNAVEALKTDTAGLTELEIGKDGKLVIPEGMQGRGPISALVGGLAAKNLAITTEFEAELAATGVVDMFFANKLTAQPRILTNCGSIAAIKPRIEKHRADQKAIINAALVDAEKLDIPSDFKIGFVSGMRSALNNNFGEVDQQWDLHSRSMDAAQSACIVLARRNWRAKGDLFEFTQQRDLDVFNRHNDELNRIAAQIDELLKQQDARLKKGQDMIKRGL
jgi:hypothetical protein